MASNLELIGINERSGLITPNLYKQDWTVPSNVLNNYSVLHTRALSDTTTPIYGKGTGIFLDTTNGGGEYDINGNPSIIGSGRNNAISINTSQWSYGPTTSYSVTNTRALSDTTTPIYGKGTGIFLDTTNGGGEYDINGNQINFPGSGRNNAISINTSQWSYGPTTPYSVINTRALSDTLTPIYGKGTGIFLDTTNGGGEYDINGNQINFPGSGRGPLMVFNYSKWTFGPATMYTMLHSHALASGDVHGKGTNDGMGIDGTYAAHTNYAGGSSDDIITRNSVIFGMNKNLFVPTIPNTYYTTIHPNALAPTSIPPFGSILGSGDEHGKGTLDSTALNLANEFVLPAHTNYGGGSTDDIISRNNSIKDPQNTYWVDISSPTNSTNWYTTLHPNAKSTGDVHGKGTLDSTVLNVANNFVLPAHTNYNGGSSDDIASRNSNVNNANNTYKVDTVIPSSITNWYTMSHPNALAGIDIHGKGTNDAMDIDGTYAAHMNYKGGSNDDIILGRVFSNTTNFTTTLASGNKPFGYGYKVSEGYDSSYPICSNAANTINVGAVHW